MRRFERATAEASARRDIPGAVALASDKSGNLYYVEAFGNRSVREGADQSPLTPDSVMWIASCTKLVTAVAALQCVERGVLTLDGPIYDVLPELKGKQVLKGFDDDGRPILVPHTKAITLRNLLTHQSGFAYDETHPGLMAWHNWNGTRPNFADTVEARFGHYPLVFEPGESWFYGCGTDWAGVAIERASGSNLQQVYEENIFRPAGAHDIVFGNFLHTRPDLEARVVDMSLRHPKKKAIVPRRADAPGPHNRTGGCFGGQGLYSSPLAYLKLLRAVLTTDENGMLLSRTSTNELFRPCLGDAPKKGLNRLLRLEEVRIGMGNIPASAGGTKSWALGGIVNEEDIAGGRRGGTMTWTGLPNLLWFIDRRSGLCGHFSAQLLPAADKRTGELLELFERGLYEMHSGKSSRL